MNLWREFFDSADLRIKLKTLKSECNGLREDVAAAHVRIQQLQRAEIGLRETISLLNRKNADQGAEIVNLKQHIKQNARNIAQ